VTPEQRAEIRAAGRRAAKSPLTPEQIVAALRPVAQQIRKERRDGQGKGTFVTKP
jgi:hypothetical protein